MKQKAAQAMRYVRAWFAGFSEPVVLARDYDILMTRYKHQQRIAADFEQLACELDAELRRLKAQGNE